MAVVSSYCPSCQRTVYVGDSDTLSCPVCASPLVTTTEPENGSRVVRIADNESLFREVNERIENAIGETSASVDELTGFVCECGQKDCTATVTISPRDYEGIRKDPAHFLVLKGHEVPEAERVVEQRDGFLVVEKVGLGRVIAEAKDPRG